MVRVRTSYFFANYGEKLLNEIFRRYQALHAFSRNIDLMSRKRDQKVEKKCAQIFGFPSFRLWPLVSILDQSRF